VTLILPDAPPERHPVPSEANPADVIRLFLVDDPRVVRSDCRLGFDGRALAHSAVDVRKLLRFERLNLRRPLLVEHTTVDHDL
jgi:hypothetical protein